MVTFRGEISDFYRGIWTVEGRRRPSQPGASSGSRLLISQAVYIGRWRLPTFLVGKTTFCDKLTAMLRYRRWDFATWSAVVALSLGLFCVLTGIVQPGAAAQTAQRVAPLVIFLGAIIVFAELLVAVGVFTWIAQRLAYFANGSYSALFGCCAALAAATTMFLNLDTTAVLLTPIFLSLAQELRIPALPLAMTAVWLANTASLLFPVSNLTNLLAVEALEPTTAQFAREMAAAQLAAVMVTVALLWALFWRPIAQNHPPFIAQLPSRPPDVWLSRIGGGCLAGFVVAIVAGLDLAVVSIVAATALTVAAGVRNRAILRWGLLPWRLLAFVIGLFLVVQAMTSRIIGDLPLAAGNWGIVQAAALAAFLANAINNLPSYVTLEAMHDGADANQVLGLLLGSNIGPLITPWSSLAILLWHERCRAAGVQISWIRFMRAGAVAAPLILSAAVAAFLATR